MREKISIRREGSHWVCRRPPYGFGDTDTRQFGSWRTAMDWATAATAGSVASADLQLAGQLQDAVGAVPMWTPLTFR